MKDILFFDSDSRAESHYEKLGTSFCADRHLVIVTSNFPDTIAWQSSALKLNYDLILCAFHDSHLEHQILAWVKHCAPEIPCLAVGYSRDYQMARAAWLAGADDYLHCDDLLNMNVRDVLAESAARLLNKRSIYSQQDPPGIFLDNQSSDRLARSGMDIDAGEQIWAAETGMIQKAKAYIHGHFMEHSLSLGSVSQHVSLSEKHFSMLFSRSCHITFSDYVMRCRMEKAKELLFQSDQKIYQIALQVGYSSVEHFSRYFKKYTGQSPERFRD